MIENDNEYEINITQIINAIKKLYIKILIICISTTVLALLFTTIFVDKQYLATGKLIIVQSSSQSQSELDYNDIVLNQKLVDTYKQILLSDKIADIVLSKVATDMTSEEFKKQLQVNAISNTEVINLSIETFSPELSADIINTTLAVFQTQIYEIMSIQNVNVLDNAKVPTTASSPNIFQNMLLGLLVGLLISGVLVIYDLFKNNYVLDEDDLYNLIKVPVIGIIPQFTDTKEVTHE